MLVDFKLSTLKTQVCDYLDPMESSEFSSLFLNSFSQTQLK